MQEHEEMLDPKKIEEILNIVSAKVPGLLKELSGVLYSPEQAKQFSLAAATFYKELKAAGMTDEQAFELTNQYMSTMNVAHTMKSFSHHGWHSPGGPCGPAGSGGLRPHGKHGLKKLDD